MLLFISNIPIKMTQYFILQTPTLLPNAEKWKFKPEVAPEIIKIEKWLKIG